MAYQFERLPQLSDQRKTLPRKGLYSKRTRVITDRAWHHSLTKKDLAGSTAAGFARYHVESLRWPGVGYTFVIEPQNVVATSNGRRARIVYCHDIDRRTYHVGNSNQFALGICVAGDYRTEELDDYTIMSIAELQQALVDDKIGQVDKSHHEFPGYSWKQCCRFDYQNVINITTNISTFPKNEVPSTYMIQEGDTYWSIAHKESAAGVTVDDLRRANPDVDPTQLRVGQVINFNLSEADVKGSKKINGFVEVLSSTLNRRKEPSFTSTVTGQLTRGMIVKVYAKQGQLFHIGSLDWCSANAPYVKYHQAIHYRRLLRVGSPLLRGDDVRYVQGRIKVLGFDPGSIDGIYGNRTRSAVRMYQQSQRIQVDGIVGQQTWGQLFD
ncbi:peptidoglycan-binding protein [Halalkalibacter sp. AB-rgal2]|uniref:peptidoglycan-binding protein n=1 Tax=Halalkalibacter sp. AB-rgal2 TaxID=3242695 RepID=UPI00359EFB22